MGGYLASLLVAGLWIVAVHVVASPGGLLGLVGLLVQCYFGVTLLAELNRAPWEPRR